MSLAPRSRGYERNATRAVARRSALPHRAVVVALLGGGLVAIEAALRGETNLRLQIAEQLVAFAVFLPAAFLSWRGLGAGRAGVVLVLGIALVLRLTAFDWNGAPPLSTDVNRYAWDARVQAHGVNPYLYAPTDPRLRGLRDARIWPAINHPTWRTNYPPGAESSFAVARGVFGHGLRATTWLFLSAELAALGTLLLVMRRLEAPPERVLVAAWHPLAISEIAANGHVDSLAVLSGAILLAAVASRRSALAAVAVAAGTLVKFGPLLLAPALARRYGRRFVILSLALVGLGYLAYISAGGRVVGTTPRLIEREDVGSLAWYELVRVMNGDHARVLLLVVLLAVVAVVSLRAHDSVEQVARTALVVLGGELLATSYLQPWYALWLLPFLVVTAAPGWLWLTGTLPLIYVFGIEQPLPWWVRATIYGPFLALAVTRVLRPRRPQPVPLRPLPRNARVAAVIPVLNEAESLPHVLAEFPPGTVDEIVVVDGGSSDETVELARAAGARVLVEKQRGYGRACLSGAEATRAEVVVFLDGDGSDDPRAITSLAGPVLAGDAALVLGARRDPQPGAQRLHQRVGNHFVAGLVRVVYGVRVSDIPPMRAANRDLLVQLRLSELTYGWPTEMVIKTAQTGLPIVELLVPSRPRLGGRSKVSGRLVPSIRAGARMLAVVARYS